MSDQSDPGLVFARTWEELAEGRDLDGLMDILEPDVTFSSPAVFRPYSGRDTVVELLRNIIEVVPDLSYCGRFTSSDGRVILQFEGHTQLDGKSIVVNGVDIFTLSEAGTVSDLTVMLRPFRALEGVMTNMGRRLAARLSWQEKAAYWVRSKLGLRQPGQ